MTAGSAIVLERRASPTPGSTRIRSLDVLRGFALLGILVVNVGAFSTPAAAYPNPTVWGDLQGLEGWIWALIQLFADLKFMAIFAMLFGAGIVLMWERNTAINQPSAGLHYRRMFWLIVFGLVHAHLLWYGDILYWYGMAGLIAFPFRKLSPAWLIPLGLLSLAVASAVLILVSQGAAQWSAGEMAAAAGNLSPPPEVLAREVAAYRGGWLDQMEMRIPKALEMETVTFLVWAGWRVGGLMLLGMALQKLGVFSGRRSVAFYLGLIALAIVAGLPLVGSGIHYNFSIGWEPPWFMFIGHQFNYWGSLPVALGWVGAIMLVCKSGSPGWLTDRLAAVGRTALSNYFLQTLICTTIFYGHGLGLFGRVGRAWQMLLVAAVWLLQLFLSPLWLRKYRFGPLEWAWRSLAYLKAQPFLR